MMLIFGLMLLQTAACVEFNCSFGQSDPCYAALGHKLNLPMLDDRYYKLQIIKRINNNIDDPFCKVKNDTKSKTFMMYECDLYNNRSEVTFINGTLIINRVISEDSGNYTLKLYGSGGTETSTDLQVKVEAPIGSVKVSLTCSSSGEKSVSCSSDGDLIIYSWNLNGDPLTDANTNILHLNETTGGVISCTVKNHVSDRRKNISLDCPGTTTVAVTSRLTSTLSSSTQTPPGQGTPLSPAATNVTLTQSFGEIEIKWFMIVLGCVALVLILLFITVCHFYTRKQITSTPAPAGDTELVYAQISHGKHNKKREKKKSESLPAADVEYAAVGPQTKRKELKEEEEVQYGEVTFTPHQSNAQRAPKEESLYAQVQRP